MSARRAGEPTASAHSVKAPCGRAAYGKQILVTVSRELTAEFDSGSLHYKIEADRWARRTAVQLASCIAHRESGKRGFPSQNLWHMRQFFGAYPDASNLSTLLRDLRPPVLVKMNDLPKSQQPRSNDLDFWGAWVGNDKEGNRVPRDIDRSTVAADWQGTQSSSNKGLE